MTQEIWKDVVGFEGYYQVSNFGNVKSMDRLINNHANTKSFRYGKIMCLKKHYKGYLYVSLHMEGNRKECKIHRLVLSAFTNVSIDYPMQVNHKDSNRSNNNLQNLEWCTASENLYHSYNTNGREGFKSKIVLDTETGIFYDSIKLAAIAKGIKQNTIYSKLNGIKVNTTSLKQV